MPSTVYLERLQQSLTALEEDFDQKKKSLGEQIKKETYYLEHFEELISEIFRIGNVTANPENYKNARIRGISNHQFPNTDAKSMIFFDYEFNGDKYASSTYDTFTLTYKNDDSTTLDNSDGMIPIQTLLSLLGGNGSNYEKLHNDNWIFRWGDPERLKLD